MVAYLPDDEDNLSAEAEDDLGPAPRRRMDIILQRDLAVLKTRMGTIDASVAGGADAMRDVRRALWGPEDNRQREVEPGLVSVVHQLAEADKQRRAVTGAVKWVLATIGIGNAVTLAILAARLLSGESVLP